MPNSYLQLPRGQWRRGGHQGEGSLNMQINHVGAEHDGWRQVSGIVYDGEHLAGRPVRDIEVPADLVPDRLE